MFCLLATLLVATTLEMKTLKEERTELLESINKFEHIRESMRRSEDWSEYSVTCTHLAHLGKQLEKTEEQIKSENSSK